MRSRSCLPSTGRWTAMGASSSGTAIATSWSDGKATAACFGSSARQGEPPCQMQRRARFANRWSDRSGPRPVQSGNGMGPTFPTKSRHSGRCWPVSTEASGSFARRRRSRSTTPPGMRPSLIAGLRRCRAHGSPRRGGATSPVGGAVSGDAPRLDCRRHRGVPLCMVPAGSRSFQALAPGARATRPAPRSTPLPHPRPPSPPPRRRSAPGPPRSPPPPGSRTRGR